MEEYPLQKFHFSIEWGGIQIGFTEVSGLDVETEVIDFNDGLSREYTSKKMPGRQKYSNITCKRGTFESVNDFYQWWDITKLFGEKTGEFRRDITINLLNEEHEPIISWKVKRAWPAKIQSTDLNAGNSEPAIETMELTHEGIVVQNGD